MVLAGSNTGIVFTIAALLAAVLVFALVKVASSLKRGGQFDIVIKRLGLLDPHELRFNVEFENNSKNDQTLNDLCLCYFQGGELKTISKMAYQPLPRGMDLNFVVKNNGNYGFFIEKGKKQSAVIDYLLPESFALPKGARFCLSFVDMDGSTFYAFVDLQSLEASLLSFKHLKK